MVRQRAVLQYVGDGIWPTVNNYCTNTFYFTGNNSGNVFGLTAGHCEGSKVITNDNQGYTFGYVSTNYFKTTSANWDVESITCPNGCDGSRVYTEPYGGSVSTKSVRDTLCGSNCAVGDKLAMDGAITGEKDNSVILSEDHCFEAVDLGVTETTCHLDEAQNDHLICQDGDSGGPVFQNEGSSGDVLPAGLIVASNDSGDNCLYHPFGQVLNLVNGSLYAG